MKVLKIVLLVIFIGLSCLLYDCGMVQAIGHLNQGYEYIDQGKLKDATAEFQKVNALDPDNHNLKIRAQAYLDLGDACREQGELDNAITSYQ